MWVSGWGMGASVRQVCDVVGVEGRGHQCGRCGDVGVRKGASVRQVRGDVGVGVGASVRPGA